MNGATPVGPRVLIKVSATATDAACATTDSLWKDASNDATAVGRTYCPTIPTRIASTTDVVTSGELFPHAVKRRSSTSPAREKESARKNTQAKHTTWNVSTR